MLAAAVTLWVLFAVWLASPFVGAPAGVTRTAAGFVAAELLALLTWSYGCAEGDCGLVAQAAGELATVDLPVLAGLFLAVVGTTAWRRGLAR